MKNTARYNTQDLRSFHKKCQYVSEKVEDRLVVAYLASHTVMYKCVSVIAIP